MKQDVVRSASYTVECEDYVHVVEFSPFESGAAGALLAYGGNQYVVVGSCRFQEEDTEVDGIEYTTLRVFHHGVCVDAIAWSPESRLDALPKQIRFCTASADRKLRILTSDLQDRHEVKVMDGHSDYVNDLVFDPKDGQQIASVSDDHTCRIWDLDGSQKISFLLRSPGMSVCWHPEDAFKLMVAEKNGMVRFYDLITQQAILSLDCGLTPLMSADWCFANTIKVGAVAGNDWVIWDITRSSYPQEKRPAHVDRTRLFKWSKANENIFATTGCPGKINSQLLVHHLGHPQLSSIPGLEDVKIEGSSQRQTAVTNSPVSDINQPETPAAAPTAQPPQSTTDAPGSQKENPVKGNVMTVAKDPRYARYLKMVQVPPQSTTDAPGSQKENPVKGNVMTVAKDPRYARYLKMVQVLTATTLALTWEDEDKHTLSSEACAISRLLFFTLRTHHAATQELQRQRTTQLSGSLQASPQVPGQTTGVAGARTPDAPVPDRGVKETKKESNSSGSESSFSD
ncbi:UNVERIFIED_CONTAM: hypothetical protein FKN15_046128 [Acipenser sinensis]